MAASVFHCQQIQSVENHGAYVQPESRYGKYIAEKIYEDEKDEGSNPLGGIGTFLANWVKVARCIGHIRDQLDGRQMQISWVRNCGQYLTFAYCQNAVTSILP